MIRRIGSQEYIVDEPIPMLYNLKGYKTRLRNGEEGYIKESSSYEGELAIVVEIDSTTTIEYPLSDYVGLQNCYYKELDVVAILRQ